MEQHAAQIAASLRGGFDVDAPPELTAAACPVLATYVTHVAHEAHTVKSRLAPLLLDRIPSLRALRYAQYGELAATLVQVRFATTLLCSTSR